MSLGPITKKRETFQSLKKETKERPPISVIDDSVSFLKSNPRESAIAGGVAFTLLGAGLHARLAPSPPLLAPWHQIAAYGGVPAAIFGVMGIVKKWVQTSAESVNGEELLRKVVDVRQSTVDQITKGNNDLLDQVKKLTQKVTDKLPDLEARIDDVKTEIPKLTKRHYTWRRWKN